MARLKKYLFVPLLVLWGISSIFVWVKPNLPKARADGFTVTAVYSATTKKITITFPKYPAAILYKISVSGTSVDLKDFRVDEDPAPATNTYIYPEGTTNLQDGVYNITVKPWNTVTDTAFTEASTSVTAGTGGNNPPAGGSTSPVDGNCTKASDEGAAKGKITAENLKPTGKGSQTSLFQTINQDGVKKVFRWSLSLVNLITLLFLLAITLANILRIDVDTYSVKKVFIPLLMGVILANFSWLISRFFIEMSTILYAAIVSGNANAGAGSDLGHAGAVFFESIVKKGYGLTDICGIATGVGPTSITSGLLGSIVGTALVLVAGILILTLYLLLVARVWIITILIVIAPLAFLCLGFPMTKNYFKKWWTLFFSWVFMAPAAFLILKLAQVAGSIGDGPNLSRYIIVTALIYYAIQVPFKMGGDWMRQWGDIVSKAKRNSSKLAISAADKSTKGVREGAVKNLKAAAWNTRYGQNISAGLKRRQLKTENLDNRLAAAQGKGAAKYVEGQRGGELLRDRSQFAKAVQEQQDTLKLAEQKGEVDFMRSGTPEANRIRARLAEISRKQELNAEELHHLSADDVRKFRTTAQGRHIDEELAKLGREKTALEAQLKELDNEAAKSFEATAQAADITKEITELEMKNLNIEKEVSNKQKEATRDFKDSSSGRALTADLKKLGYEEIEIDNMIAQAQASGDQEFFSRDPDFARGLVKRATESGLKKDEAENIVKTLDGELKVEYLDNTQGSSALRKANFSMLEIQKLMKDARGVTGLTAVDKSDIRARLGHIGITGAEADRVIADIAVDDDSGLKANIKAEKAKLDSKLADADVEASATTARGLAQDEEINNNGKVGVRRRLLEMAKRTTPRDTARIALLTQELEKARVEASQNSSIARAAIIASKDGLKETESANSLLFYAGDTNGATVLDKRIHWQGFVKTNETGVTNIENLAKQSYRAGDDAAQLLTAQRLGINKDQLEEEKQRIDAVTVKNIYTTKNAERETRKGKERVIGAIMHSQSYVEREKVAQRKVTHADAEFTNFAATANLSDPAQFAAYNTKRAERDAARTELTASIDEKNEYERIMNNEDAGPKPGDEESWEKVAGKWKLKAMDRDDIDRLRAEYAVIQKERATSESNRSIDEKIAEWNGTGVDIHDTWVDTYDASGKKDGGHEIITAQQFIQARLNNDHKTISKVLHNGHAIKVDAAGNKSKGKARDTRFNLKANGWIGAGIQPMSRYMDPEGQKLLPHFATNVMPKEMLQKIVKIFKDSPKYAAIDAKGNTPASKFKDLLEHATDEKSQRYAFASNGDQQLQKLFIGAVQELQGSIQTQS